MTAGTVSQPDPARVAAARAGFEAAKQPRADGPSREPEALRRAYLDLLKLSVCDLVGSTTLSVGRTDDGRVMSRELAGDQLKLRSAGMDWPLQGLTMAGLARLDDLQACVETVVADGVPGDLIEAGVWRGGASILMRATLDTLGVDDRTVWVADSFAGFPQDDEAAAEDKLDWFDFLAVPLEEVKASFERLGCGAGVRFVPGFFEETLPDLRDGRWSLVRLDADTYELTSLALDSLYPGLAPGGFLIVDDYGALDECREAVDGFRARHAIREPLEQVDWTCVRWRRESSEPLTGGEDAPARKSRPAPRAVERRPDARVPSMQELELRDRLAAAEARLAWLEESPLRAPREWLRRRVGR